MRLSRRIGPALVLAACPAAAGAYSAVADVTVDFGGTDSVGGYSAGGDMSWTSFWANRLDEVRNDIRFTQMGGANSLALYNSPFATAQVCTEAMATSGLVDPVVTTRKYGCRAVGSDGSTAYTGLGISWSGLPPGRATGTLTATDTTLSGVLQIESTTGWLPQGATTFVTASGIRLSNSVGDGATGFNYRMGDGNLYGNSWHGVSTSATLTVNLTGVFTSSSWQVTGGSARLHDPEFACQQSGYGGPSPQGTLCNPGTTAGAFQVDGAHLSWGVDPDGAGPRTDMTGIEVRDALTNAVIENLSGVWAQMSVINGQIVTNHGEFRRSYSLPLMQCADHIKYDPVQRRVTCGTLVAGLVNFSGTVSEVPVPAVGWLLATPFGWILARARRR